MADASECAVGAVLQQDMGDGWRPIAFFSRKLGPAERKCSTFDRELLAVYLTIKHFRYFVEGHKFYQCQVRHLDFISQFTGDIRHVSGGATAVEDAL
jgi:hypothetical protein